MIAAGNIEVEHSFDSPWQAELVAATRYLCERGVMTWPEWVDGFSREIAARPQTEAETVNDAYYRQWLAALERLLWTRGLATGAEIDDTQEHWRRSYLNTEHGQPVEFRRDLPSAPAHDDDHDHRQDHDHTQARPVFVDRPAPR